MHLPFIMGRLKPDTLSDNVPASSVPGVQGTDRPDIVPEGDGRRMLQSDRLNPWMNATEPGR
jgi:hypothetical protein